MAWLCHDDAQGARQAVEQGSALLTRRGYHAQHYYALYACAQIDLYEGDGVSGLQRIERDWPRLRASMLLQVQTVRVEMTHLRARCALAAALQQPERQPQLVRMAVRDAKRLLRLRSVLAAPMAQTVLAAVAHLRGDEAACASRLRLAIERFDGAGIAMYAAVARRRLGALAQATAAEVEQARAATQYMRDEGVVDVERWTDMLAPGFRSVSPRGLARV
jgi:hypothetical protein